MQLAKCARRARARAGAAPARGGARQRAAPGRAPARGRGGDWAADSAAQWAAQGLSDGVILPNGGRRPSRRSRDRAAARAQAMAAYRTAARLFPGLHAPLAGMGMEYARMNNAALAEQLLAAAHAACPRDPLPAHELGCLAFRARGLPAAERWLKLALKRMPGRLSPGARRGAPAPAPRPPCAPRCAPRPPERRASCPAAL